MVSVPAFAQTAGIPSSYTEAITVGGVALVTGNEPAVMTQDMIVAASQVIPALSPVALDANKRLIPAVSGTSEAIGIAVVAITSSASTTYKAIPVYRAGCFNPDALSWPASYNTDALKLGAFEGAPTPTNIVMRRPKTHTV